MENLNHASKISFLLLKGNISALLYEINQSDELVKEYKEYILKFHEIWVKNGRENDYSKGHSIWNNSVNFEQNYKISYILRNSYFTSIETFLLKEGVRKVTDIKEEVLLKLLYHSNIGYEKYFTLLKTLFGEFGRRDYDALIKEQWSHAFSTIENTIERTQELTIKTRQEEEKINNSSKDVSAINTQVDLMKNLKEADMRIKKDLEEVSSTINSVLKESWEKEEVIQQLNKEIQNFKEANTNLKKEIEDLRKVKEDFSKLKELLLRMDREHAES